MPEARWSGVWRWDAFEVDPTARELRRDGRRVAIQDQPFEVLLALLETPGRDVSREDLFGRLWAEDTFVDRESGLNSAIKKLRDVLGDTAQAPRFIETRARHGYRFIAPLDAVATPPVRGGPPPPGLPEPSRARPWLAVAAVALVAVGGFLAWQRRQAGARDPEGAILVVLPFENLSGDPNEEYFSDGMTDEMISRLGQLRAEGVSVLGGATSRHYKGSGKRAGEIAAELDADYALGGSVRRAADRVRITVELVRSRDHRLLWGQSYDRELRDVLDLQREVALAIAAELPSFGAASPPLSPAGRVDPAAYEAYLKGRYFWNKVSIEGERKAIEMFQEAIRIDPDFALAYSWQGSAYQMMGNLGGMPSAEVLGISWPLVTRGVELDPHSADTLGCLGWASLLYRWDFSGAERAFRRALEINPNHANARHGLATYFALMGRFDEALVEIERAHRSDPLLLVVDAEVGAILYLAGRDQEALARLQQTLELDPNFPPTRFFLAAVYRSLGRRQEAFEESLRAVALAFGGEPPWQAAERQAFAEGGWLGWQRYWADLSTKVPEIEEFGTLAMAEVYLELGSPQVALDWLDKAYLKRPYQVAYLKVDPVWKPLRGEPRFQALLRRVGLPP